MTPQEQSDRFHKFIWPHRALVLRTARLLTRDAAEGEDLAQETLMRAFNKINQFDVATSAPSWLTAILRHVRIDQVRIKSNAILTRAQSIDGVALAGREPFEVGDSSDPEILLEQFSDQGVIDALQTLPEEIRWTLLLIDVRQMSYEEAAGILDVPAGTVKSRAHRGRLMLREQLLGICTGGEMAAGKADFKSPRRIS